MMRVHVISTCVCLCGILTAAAFTPDRARQLFGESGLDASTPVAEVEDCIFMRIAWKPAADEDVTDDEEQLSAVLAALESYIAPPHVPCANSPFCKTLTEWMEPELTYVVPSVASCVLKDESKNGERVCVMAFEAAPLKQEKAAALARMTARSSRTQAEWEAALKETAARFKTRADKIKFNALLGCPVVTLVNQGDKASLTELENGSGVEEIRKILRRADDKESFFAKNKMLAWSSVREDRDGAFYPAWTSDDGGRFKEAVDLFQKGRDLDRILTLLAGSIAANPVGREKWQYLAAALKCSGQYEDAVFAYVQTLRFDPQNKDAWKGLQTSLEKAGFEVNAKGLGWYLRSGLL